MNHPAQTDSQAVRDHWFIEEVPGQIRQALAVTRILHEEKSAQQDVLVFENPDLGRVLALDGVVQLTEADEFIYHEMMAHVPVLSHAAPKNVLIIGGGDGGILREVLRHDTVESARLVEIDDSVITLSRAYFPTVHGGAFDDPRATVTIADGAAFIAETAEKYDIIIVDSSDPFGPSAVLFTPEFYGACYKALRDDGILVAMNGVPFTDPEELKQPFAHLRGIFPHVAAYTAVVPTYHGGHLAISFAAKGTAQYTNPRPLPAAITTRYYNTAMHSAAFALPPFINALLAE